MIQFVSRSYVRIGNVPTGVSILQFYVVQKTYIIILSYYDILVHSVRESKGPYGTVQYRYPYERVLRTVPKVVRIEDAILWRDAAFERGPAMQPMGPRGLLRQNKQQADSLVFCYQLWQPVLEYREPIVSFPEDQILPGRWLWNREINQG